jgi:anaerobic dimethyl sulfoxide reductase subunit A
MSEKNSLKKALNKSVLSRRSFLKWSAALGGSAALAGGLKVGFNAVEAAPEPAEDRGQWISAACWHNCGGRCPNYALVKDGVVLRQKIDDTHPDTPDYPQQRACGRGRAQRYMIYGADRLKYPMKRKNWEPGGGNKELRGKDEWVRITWEEALDTVASEIKRIKEKYGNESILSIGTEISRTLGLYGGYATAPWGTVSWGTWRWTGPAVGHEWGRMGSDRFDLRNSQLIVHWGANPIWSSGGNPTYHYLQAKKAGARFIFIDPFYNDSAQVLADEWIPIRPTTDHAMVLGMAYTLITEDDPEDNPLIDWDFLHRCTIGFDKDHLPEGADPKDNFRDYVLGTYDGTPKTPDWASEICGVDPNRIRSLAREIATTKKVALFTAPAAARVNNADSWPQAFMTLGWMTGHVGQSGRQTAATSHNRAGNQGPPLISSGSSGVSGIANPLEGPSISPRSAIWKAIVDEEYVAGKDDVRSCNIQLIFHGGWGAALNQSPGLVKGVEAHRKVEFVVSQSQFLTTNCRYSDIVLPVTTEWERYGRILTGNREILIWASQVSEPLFEAKDDIWIAKEIGKRLGLDPDQIDPVPLKQQIFNRVAGAKVIKADGSEFEPLVTITAADIADMGVEGEPQQGRISLKEFKEKGIYQVPRSPDDDLVYVPYKDFREDPETYPAKTASGKFEIHCQSIADFVESIGYTTIKPIPTYNRPIEGYEDTFDDWENKVKGDYPLQLYTIHYPRRSHSSFDNALVLREAFPQEFMMNTVDAAERGIEHGDAVLVKSRHGQILRPVYVTSRMMPGVVTVGQGAWAEFDEEDDVDLAGSSNTLNGPISTGQYIEGWNSCNVQVEKWTGKPITPDKNWPQRIPLKEA